MKSVRLLFILVLLLSMGTSIQAQRNCGSMEHLEKMIETHPKIANKMRAIETHTLRNQGNTNRQLITIPVVVHVVYNSNAENISDAQIQSQIQILTEDFRRTNSDRTTRWPQAADSEFEFCLATVDPNGNATNGITRTQTSTTSFSDNDRVKFNSTGGHDAWPATEYLNFWVCDLNGFLGYAQFPGGPANTDGVVCDYQYVGNMGTATSPFDLGRTATHEVGHWLNLRHIWGDGNCSRDDFVSDTPTSDAANYGCATGHVSCSTVDMVENYMDYSDDACMNLFTLGQKNRMQALFTAGGSRVSLLSSAACGTPPPPATCTDGIQNGNETGIDCGGPDCPPCPCAGTNVTVNITFDQYASETSWDIKDANGVTFASGSNYGGQGNGSSISVTTCLPNACYDFTIYDTYGDGICCAYGNGSYTVVDENGVTLASGGSFTFSETTNFCLGGTPPPATCTDGIQNGNETGIDCGGPDCPPCVNPPTCTDGIQNGNETGVDCGGPDCPPCVNPPTCTDGIQNGNETGVDCGGPDCPPCNPGTCTYVTLDAQNFDGGWGIWNDGGSDCRRSSADSPYANSGTYCIRLRDNTNSSVMTTDNLNLTPYSKVAVDFSYYVRSFEGVEDFWLQISTNGGASYTTVEDWVRNTDFVNNSRSAGNATIEGPFTSNTRLRFRCDATANGDLVYIDDVTIRGCGSGARNIEEVFTATAEEDAQANLRGQELQTAPISDLLLFPNPTSETLNIAYTLQEAGEVQLTVIDISGKVMQVQAIDAGTGRQETEINANQLPSGYYFIQMTTKDYQVVDKFVVVK